METTAGSVFDSTESMTALGLKDNLKIFYVAVIILGTIGVVGNLLVLVILFMHRPLRKPLTSTLIINQSLVDLTGSLFLSLTYLYLDSPYEYFDSPASYLACYFLEDRMLMFSSMNVSTFSLLAITLERYVMIVHPIMHRNSVKRSKLVASSVLTWLIGYAWTCAPSFPFKYIENKSCVLYQWPSLQQQRLWGILYIIGSFFLPMILFIGLYTHILIALHQKTAKVNPSRRSCRVQPQAVHEIQDNAKQSASTSEDRGKAAPHFQIGLNNMGERGQCTDHTQPTSSNSASQTKKVRGKLSTAQINVTRTMIVVTVAFAVCWTPNQIYYLCFNLGYNVDFLSADYLLTLFLCFSNCCINPFIYAFKFKALRKIVLHKCGCHRQQETGTESFETSA